MKIDTHDANAVSGFYAVPLETFAQSLSESHIEHSIDMGGGVTVHHGTRNGHPVWLIENALGVLYGVLVEDERVPH